MKMFINITIEFDNKQYDLSLDSRQRIHIAVEILMRYLKVPTLPVTFYRSKMQGKVISAYQTFQEANIHSGDLLSVIK